MFWTETFLAERKADWMRHISKAEYCINGKWQKTEISEKSIIDGKIKITTFLSEHDTTIKITGIRILDVNDRVIGEQPENLKLAASQGLMSIWEFSIFETA